MKSLALHAYDTTKPDASLQALRQRKEGPSLPLKELHNDVKRQLIYRQAGCAPTVPQHAQGHVLSDPICPGLLAVLAVC